MSSFHPPDVMSSLHSPDVIHVMNAPGLFPLFASLLLSYIICEHKWKVKACGRPENEANNWRSIAGDPASA